MAFVGLETGAAQQLTHDDALYHLQHRREGDSALVLGAGGAIGQAFVTRLQSDPRCAGATALSRQSEPAFDLMEPVRAGA